MMHPGGACSFLAPTHGRERLPWETNSRRRELLPARTGEMKGVERIPHLSTVAPRAHGRDATYRNRCSLQRFVCCPARSRELQGRLCAPQTSDVARRFVLEPIRRLRHKGALTLRKGN